MKRFQLIVLGFVTLVLGIYSLPQISISVNEEEYSFPALDVHAIFENNSDIGNLRKSIGIFHSNLYEIQIVDNTDRQTFNRTFQILEQRLADSQLNDIILTAYFGEISSYYTLEIPNYYKDQGTIVDWLTRTGQISFESIDQEGNINSLNIDAADITSIGSDYDSIYDDHISLRFNDDAQSTFQSLAFAGSSITMSIDGEQLFLLAPQVDQNSAVQTISDEVKVVYLEDVQTVKEKQVILNIVVAIIASEEIAVPVFPPIISSTSPDYTPYGASSFGYILMISLLLSAGYVYQRTNWKKATMLIFATTLTATTLITMLKLVAAPVSIGTVVAGSIMFLLIMQYFFYFYQIEDADEFEDKRKQSIRVLASMLIVIFLILGLSIKSLFLYDMLGVIITTIISLLFIMIHPITVIRFIDE